MSVRGGAAAVAVTPKTVLHLDGYPHVERFSEGVDTDLFSSALYLEQGADRVLLIGHDLLLLDRSRCLHIRAQIAARTGVPADHIMLTCTHTHSAPVTHQRPRAYPDYSPAQMNPDATYMRWLEERIIANAVEAAARPRAVELGFALADATGIGGNRRDPDGPAHPETPVVLVRDLHNQTPLALMMVLTMHPTVLHEDSRCLSGDFPGHARSRLQETLGPIPVVIHQGASGNQSPRHVARENTVAEAQRLGHLLADQVLAAVGQMTYSTAVQLRMAGTQVPGLPTRRFPPLDEAQRAERAARKRFDQLRHGGQDHHATRTAECDWFGAERLVEWSRLQSSGDLEKALDQWVRPAEVQACRIGPWVFVAWPGEVFVEFALELRQRHPEAFMITCANGHLYGYLVTKAAVEETGYEASGAALESPETPLALLAASEMLLNRPDLDLDHSAAPANPNLHEQHTTNNNPSCQRSSDG